MRNVDHLILASCERMLKFCVIFTDGAMVTVWAGNRGQANILAIKRRQAENPGMYCIQEV
jgi:hypothetical protein